MRTRIAIILLAALSTAACELDLANPNAPTAEEVLSDVDGIIALGVGMQSQYGSSLDTYILPSALSGDSWGLKVAALICDEVLFTGVNESRLPTCVNVSNPYFVTYRVARSANLIMENAPQIERLGSGLETGLIALAKLYKAMALGSATLSFDALPVDVVREGAVPQPRAVVLDTVLSLLKSARADLQTVTDEQLQTFRVRVLANGVDLRNTVHAMLARYSLIAGEYQQAIDAADSVDLTVLSTFQFGGTDVNPLYNYSIAADYTRPLWSFVQQAEAGDQRPAYWVMTDSAAAVFTGQPDSLLTEPVQYSTRNDPFPVYIPDEMRLIKAEAYARLGQYGTAAGLVNDVRTQCNPGLDVPAACLGALPAAALDTEAELLDQIAYERRYELYLQGLRWEDMRRLDQHIATEPVRDYLPFPQTECTRNPNVDCAG